MRRHVVSRRPLSCRVLEARNLPRFSSSAALPFIFQTPSRSGEVKAHIHVVHVSRANVRFVNLGGERSGVRTDKTRMHTFLLRYWNFWCPRPHRTRAATRQVAVLIHHGGRGGYIGWINVNWFCVETAFDPCVCSRLGLYGVGGSISLSETQTSVAHLDKTDSRSSVVDSRVTAS